MGMKINYFKSCLQRCGVCCQQTGLIIWAQLDGLDLWSISSGTMQLAQANHLYSCLGCLVFLVRSCLLYAASQQVFIEWPWRQQQLSVQSGGGEYRESLAVGGVVPNTSLLRRLGRPPGCPRSSTGNSRGRIASSAGIVSSSSITANTQQHFAAPRQPPQLPHNIR